MLQATCGLATPSQAPEISSSWFPVHIRIPSFTRQPPPAALRAGWNKHRPASGTSGPPVYFTNGFMASVLPISLPLTSATPTYAASGTVATPVSAVFASSAIKPLGVVIDASGNAWYGITGSNTTATTGIEEVIPTTTNSSHLVAHAAKALITGTTLGKSFLTSWRWWCKQRYIPDNQGSGALARSRLLRRSQPHAASDTGDAGAPRLQPAIWVAIFRQPFPPPAAAVLFPPLITLATLLSTALDRYGLV